MNKFALSIVGIFILVTAGFDSFSWLIKEWLRTSYGHLALGIFIIGGAAIYLNKLKSRKKVEKKFIYLSILFAALGSALSPISYNIIKAGFSLGSLFFLGAAMLNLSKQRFWFYGVWAILSLPLVPLLGSTLGLVNRVIYAQILEIFFPAARRVGTSFYDGNFAYHIDAGCSGVQSIYLLIAIWVIVGIYRNSVRVVDILWGLLFFWVLNGLRVAALYVMHNRFLIENLDKTDELLGVATFTAALLFIMLRSTINPGAYEKDK